MCGTACLLHTVSRSGARCFGAVTGFPRLRRRAFQPRGGCMRPGGHVGRYLTLCKPPLRQPRLAPTHPGAGAAGTHGRWCAGSEPREYTTMERDLIFDIGVNNGDDTAHYLRRGFRVVGVEANPEMVANCERRFQAEIRAGRLVLLNAALAAEEGVVSFFVSEGHRGMWSSLDPALATRGNLAARQIAVEARSMRDLLQEY